MTLQKSVPQLWPRTGVFSHNSPAWMYQNIPIKWVFSLDDLSIGSNDTLAVRYSACSLAAVAAHFRFAKWLVGKIHETFDSNLS